MNETILTEIPLNGQRYFVEQDKGWLYLTRCLSECGGCEHYTTDCKEHHADGDFYCDRERPDVPDTYDFCDYISTEDYPEFTEQEVQMINKLIAEDDPEWLELSDTSTLPDKPRGYFTVIIKYDNGVTSKCVAFPTFRDAEEYAALKWSGNKSAKVVIQSSTQPDFCVEYP